MSFKQKELADLDFSDIEELFAKLTPEELEQLSNEVDPDVNNIIKKNNIAQGKRSK